MKKRVLCLLTVVLASFPFLNVDAKQYTKEDAEANLREVLTTWGTGTDSGYGYGIESTSDATTLISTIDGVKYLTELKYNGGIYTFTSSLSKVETESEFVNEAYADMGLTIFLIALANMYDSETKNSASSATVGNMDDVGSFTLEKDGISASLLDSSIKEVALPDGSTLSASGFYKQFAFDINHPSFIKLITGTYGTDTDIDDDFEGSLGSGGPSGPSGTETGGSGTVNNPKTGVERLLVPMTIVIVCSIVSLVKLKKFDLFKNF